MLHLLTAEALPAHVRQAGAVYFKNMCKQHWDAEASDIPIAEPVKQQVAAAGDPEVARGHVSRTRARVPPPVTRHARSLASLVAPTGTSNPSIPHFHPHLHPPSRFPAQVRDGLLPLFLVVPESLQAQLSESISIIASHDFPKRWEGLLPTLVQQAGAALGAAPKDYRKGAALLQIGLSIFRRYRHEFKSDDLFREIK